MSLSIILITKNNNGEINVLNVNISFTSYNEHIVVINDYQEFTEKVSNSKEIKEINDDFLIFGNDRTKVTEADGRTWKTKEPAIMYFFNNHCHHIGQNKNTKRQYRNTYNIMER